MRWLVVFGMLCAGPLVAQSETVLPNELTLEIIVEDPAQERFVGEMVLITIRGTYRRHITREKLVQPDFEKFNWSQLGPDTWKEERERGQKIKVMERRMAIFPKRAGTLTVGPFVHALTLTDAGDGWFDHQIASDPFTINVAPIPPAEQGRWWFPTRSLKISDQWSNPPDQLQVGEGVLRIIHLQAVGATPDMIPPMPELTSPSAMIFPHPEKRLVELSPQGPVTHAFWRWTLRPTNTTSGVLEPIEVVFFNTQTRTHELVKVSAQRVAYADQARTFTAPVPEHARLPGWPIFAFALSFFVCALFVVLRGWHFVGLGQVRRFVLFDPLAWKIRTAARRGDAHGLRQLGAELTKRDGAQTNRNQALAQLDRMVFDPHGRNDIDLFTVAKTLLGRQVTAQKSPKK